MSKRNEFEKLIPFSSTNPYLCFLGIQLLDAGPGWVKMRLPFQDAFLQPNTVHGGAIYSLADSAATHSLLTIIYPDEIATTVEQGINFLRALRRQDLYAEGRVLHLGKTLAYTEVTLTMKDGTLVGKSAATQMRLDPARWKSAEER